MSDARGIAWLASRKRPDTCPEANESTTNIGHLLHLRRADRSPPPAFVCGTHVFIQIGPGDEDTMAFDMRDVLHASERLTRVHEHPPARGAIGTNRRMYKGVTRMSATPVADAVDRWQEKVRADAAFAARRAAAPAVAQGVYGPPHPPPPSAGDDAVECMGERTWAERDAELRRRAIVLE